MNQEVSDSVFPCHSRGRNRGRVGEVEEVSRRRVGRKFRVKLELKEVPQRNLRGSVEREKTHGQNKEYVVKPRDRMGDVFPNLYLIFGPL